MSWVTDVILIFSLSEIFRNDDLEFSTSPELEKINQWLQDNGQNSLIDLSESMATGSRAFQACIYGGSFKSLDLNSFKKSISEQSWHARENLQLLIQEEQDERFSVYMFSDERLEKVL